MRVSNVAEWCNICRALPPALRRLDPSRRLPARHRLLRLGLPLRVALPRRAAAVNGLDLGRRLIANCHL